MTKTISDDRLYDILRAADPLADERERPATATDAALARLLAQGPGVRRPRRRGPHALRPPQSLWWAARIVPIAAVAAAAVAVLSVLPAGGPVTVSAASAKVIRAKAAAVIAGSDGAILHADISATQVWQGGGSEDWTEQDWQQVSAPYDERSIDSGIWPTTVEMAYVNGQMWLYDPATNTIYTNEPAPKFTLTPGSQPGTYTLRTGTGNSGPSLTVTAAQAAALRDGSDTWALTSQGDGLEVIPRPTTGPQDLSSFRSQALALLHSAAATVTSNVNVDGQSAIEVASADGTTTYYLNPTTYAPIQMSNTIGPGTNFGDPGNDSTVTLEFSDWQYLTGAAADPALLSLTAQHPDATVDNSAADWSAAASRLFP